MRVITYSPPAGGMKFNEWLDVNVAPNERIVAMTRYGSTRDFVLEKRPMWSRLLRSW